MSVIETLPPSMQNPNLVKNPCVTQHIYTIKNNKYHDSKKPRKTFEPIENVTDEDVKRIIHKALVRDFKVYDRLAEI